MINFKQMASNPITKVTEEEYLALDRAAEVRSEYFNGEIFAMSGGSMRHAQLQGNIFGELYNALRGGVCRAYGSDFRIKIKFTSSNTRGAMQAFGPFATARI